MVVISFEERARKETEETAKIIEKEYKDKFFKFLLTWHPANLPGEIPGHGSNDTWATKKAKEILIDPLKIPYQNIIVSFFDSVFIVIILSALPLILNNPLKYVFSNSNSSNDSNLESLTIF